jgi:hypothetical protein
MVQFTSSIEQSKEGPPKTAPFGDAARRAATVLNVKAVVIFYSVGNEKSLEAERLLVAHHRIQDREELSHAGGERYLLLFASF